MLLGPPDAGGVVGTENVPVPMGDPLQVFASITGASNVAEPVTPGVVPPPSAATERGDFGVWSCNLGPDSAHADNSPTIATHHTTPCTAERGHASRFVM